jgi:uncharacterized ion transporter superfamily protein YfcC
MPCASDVRVIYDDVTCRFTIYIGAYEGLTSAFACPFADKIRLKEIAQQQQALASVCV